MPNNRIGYQHINIVNIVPSAAMHTPLSIWVQPRRFEGKPGTSGLPPFPELLLLATKVAQGQWTIGRSFYQWPVVQSPKPKRARRPVNRRCFEFSRTFRRDYGHRKHRLRSQICFQIRVR